MGRLAANTIRCKKALVAKAMKPKPAQVVAFKPERPAPYQWRPVAVGLKEAAQSLGIGLTLMKDLIRDRKIPAKRCERRILVRTIDLDAYVDGLPDADTKAAQ